MPPPGPTTTPQMTELVSVREGPVFDYTNTTIAIPPPSNIGHVIDDDFDVLNKSISEDQRYNKRRASAKVDDEDAEQEINWGKVRH